MTNKDLKIKYIIGSYKDDPNYPTEEDFVAIAQKWYWFEGGKEFIHDNRGLPQDGTVHFTNNLIKEKELPKKSYDILSEMIENGKVSIVKETQHTIYHKINKQ